MNEFKNGDMSNYIGVIKSYIGEGNYLIYNTEKNKLCISFLLDIQKI
jgi:hypothetical protein